MAERWYYSDINEIGRPAGGLIRQAVPDRIRFAVANLVEAWREASYQAGYTRTAEMWVWIVRDLNWSPQLLDTDNTYRRHAALKSAIERYEWSDTLDLFSAIFYYLDQQRPDRASPFPSASEYRAALNQALMRHYSAYQMSPDGRIEEPGSHAAEAAIAEARGLLADDRFNGPDRQFQDALLAFSRRPDPNYEAVVANALNAAEGVARIVLGDTKVTLGDAAKNVARDKGLHPALADSIAKLYGYASNEGGRHGLVGDAKVDGPVAEFCLHQAAAAIVLLARLYGYEVAEGKRSG